MKPLTKNMILLLFVVLLAFAPLYIARGAEFSGADTQASEMISTLNSNYSPWFESFWEPPSGEVESFLFALQAALGSGFVFYYIGFKKGKNSMGKRDQT
ncbi:MAG TPA: energy-coupling factor ABC transporter substrate-binding protein [Desulfosporosinus sp.]|nr:energy-coupling factor ABC transporter substrate-binding protein [Desulfosporosinus sp.]